MEAAFEHYFDLHQKDPLINCIWSVVQTDADLQAIDIEDTLQNARYIKSVVGRSLPPLNADGRPATALGSSDCPIQSDAKGRNYVATLVGILSLPAANPISTCLERRNYRDPAQ